MVVLSWIRFLIGAICMVGGLVFCAIQLIGVFRFKYVLNRVHATALGDTLGSGLLLLGVLILNGLDLAGVKLMIIIVFLWFTTPVAAHMVGKLEVLSKRRPEECCPVEILESETEEEVL